MEFASPLCAALAVPAALTLWLKLRGERARDRALRRLAEPHLLPRLVPAEGKGARIFRLFLPVVVMLLLVLALMRPQWGRVEEEQSASGLDIIFALDLSRSMQADDLAPSRLAVAKAAIAKALADCPRDRAGIIGFAGTAFLLCPLTTDHEMVKSLLDELGTRTMPKGGSSLASSLIEARRAFRGTPSGGRMLVLLSDGEDHAGRLEEAAAGLRQEGIKVLAFLTATPSGALMPLGDGSYVKDRSGAVVRSRGNLETLRHLDPAAAALPPDASGLAAGIAAARANLAESARKERRSRLAERYYLPLGAAVFIWFVSAVFSRRRQL